VFTPIRKRMFDSCNVLRGHISKYERWQCCQLYRHFVLYVHLRSHGDAIGDSVNNRRPRSCTWYRDRHTIISSLRQSWTSRAPSHSNVTMSLSRPECFLLYYTDTIDESLEAVIHTKRCRLYIFTAVLQTSEQLWMFVFLVWLSLSSSRRYVVRHARRWNEVCIHQANYFSLFCIWRRNASEECVLSFTHLIVPNYPNMFQDSPNNS